MVLFRKPVPGLKGEPKYLAIIERAPFPHPITDSSRDSFSFSSSGTHIGPEGTDSGAYPGPLTLDPSSIGASRSSMPAYGSGTWADRITNPPEVGTSAPRSPACSSTAGGDTDSALSLAPSTQVETVGSEKAPACTEGKPQFVEGNVTYYGLLKKDRPKIVNSASRVRMQELWNTYLDFSGSGSFPPAAYLTFKQQNDLPLDLMERVLAASSAPLVKIITRWLLELILGMQGYHVNNAKAKVQRLKALNMKVTCGVTGGERSRGCVCGWNIKPTEQHAPAEIFRAIHDHCKKCVIPYLTSHMAEYGAKALKFRERQAELQRRAYTSATRKKKYEQYEKPQSQRSSKGIEGKT